MKLSIRMKIFLPVVLILTMLPLAFFLVFSRTLEKHMAFNARRDLEHLVHGVQTAVERASAESQDGEDELMERLKNLMKKDGGDSGMLLMNDKFRVLYPKSYDDQPEAAFVYSAFLAGNSQKDSAWEQGRAEERELGGKKYMVYYQTVEPADGRKIRHVVLYCQIHDTERILTQVSRLMLLCMAGMTAVEIVLFWLVAGSISRPVRRLCEAARGIGEKKFKTVETRATVKELCELEEEINRMQEKLAQADQAERTFFQNASHELRTPLMSISGYAQGIQCGVLEDTAQAAGVILEESSRLTEVVDGILALTRMDQLRYQVIPAETGINEFIEAHLSKLEGMALAKNIRLEFSGGEERTVITDVSLLEKAFVNVMSNCIRYAAGRVAVTVREYRGMTEITVWDDGPEISREDLEHLFERFYKGKDGNHGLGLAIAKSSLEYMGGSIEAGNAEGGAFFAIRLPEDCRSFAVEIQSET